MAVKKIKQVTTGSVVKLGGIDWVVVTPTEGTLVSKNKVTNRNYSNYTNNFYLNENDNIGYYLNSTFINQFTQKEKGYIIEKNYDNGGRTVSCKIGLLTSLDYTRNKDYLIGSSRVVTMTKGSSSTEIVMNSSTAEYVANTFDIHPVIKLNPELYVLDDGTVSDTPNTTPSITPSSTPSGVYADKPSFNYTVIDVDGHAMTITESIDGVVFNTRTGVASGTQLTFTPTDLAWLRTRINQSINITIKADDGNGGVTTVNYPITRTTPAIDMQLKTPFETDIVARRLLLQLEGNIPNDAIVSVQACNNALDASPTWENATNLVLSGFPYPFSNTTKTATKWGVSFKVRIERGGSSQPIYINGIGGAFD